jgi:hypothetical protein
MSHSANAPDTSIFHPVDSLKLQQSLLSLNQAADTDSILCFPQGQVTRMRGASASQMV